MMGALFLFLFVFIWSAGAATARTMVPVGGGAPPDLASDDDVVGSWNREQILKALDGFYANHPCNVTTKSSGDPTTIANADYNTISNDRRLVTRSSSAVPQPQGHKKLILAVPQKPGFEKIVSSAIYIFKTTVEKLPQAPPYELCAFSGTYDELVYNVSEGVFDGAVGDVTMTDERAKVVDFTAPYAPSGLALLVLVDKEPLIQWIFLKPLTNELWITTVVFFFFTGFVVWLIEAPRNPEYEGSILRQFMTAWYFIFSTLTFSHDQKLKSPLSKIALVIWCFTVLVLVQSYTANLSSILTTKRLTTGLDRLVRGHDYIGYQTGGFVDSMLINQGVPWYRLKAYNDESEYADALRKGSKNGGVSAIVDEIPYLSYFLSEPEHKKDFMISDHLNMTLGLGFAFRKGCNKTLIDVLSSSITDLMNGRQSSEYEKEWFDPAAILADSGSSERLNLRRFSGLFIITGCVSALMLLISVTRSVYAKYTRPARGSESQSGDRPEELSSAPPQNGTQRMQEVMDNDSQGAHESGGSNGDHDEEAGAVQDSISISSVVPEVSVQIEMTSTGQGVGRALYTAIPNGG